MSESTDWQETGTPDFGADTSLDREITSANTVNAGVATSSFRVFDPAGGGFDVGFDLEQSITQVGTSDISFLSQTYTMTNNSTEAASFQLVRAVDADLLFAPAKIAVMTRLARAPIWAIRLALPPFGNRIRPIRLLRG